MNAPRLRPLIEPPVWQDWTFRSWSLAVVVAFASLPQLSHAQAIDQGAQSTGRAQTVAPTKTKPSPGDASGKTAPPAAAGGAKSKSLDDLLGVPAEKDKERKSGDEAAEREQAKRLERSLEGASLDDLVTRAVDGMKSATERLAEAKDPGLGTQRIQEDVIKTLDLLLEEAKKQQKRQSSSSSSRKQSGKPQDQQGDPKEQNGQQSGKREREGSQRPTSKSSPSQENSQGDRPPDQSSTDGTQLDEARIEWGRLPERVRELVLQGRRDRVSTIYERLTREYYRRLAEEASK